MILSQAIEARSLDIPFYLALMVMDSTCLHGCTKNRTCAKFSAGDISIIASVCRAGFLDFAARNDNHYLPSLN